MAHLIVDGIDVEVWVGVQEMLHIRDGSSGDQIEENLLQLLQIRNYHAGLKQHRLVSGIIIH